MCVVFFDSIACMLSQINGLFVHFLVSIIIIIIIIIIVGRVAQSV